MKPKHLAIVVAFLGLGLALLLPWDLGPQAQTRGLAVSFVRQTNDIAGTPWAEFNLSNSFSRNVQFGVNEIQVRGPSGWADATNNLGGTNWFHVAAGTNLTFSVPVPPGEGVAWRVRIDYSQDPSRPAAAFKLGKALLGYALYKITGSSFFGRWGLRRDWSATYGPELAQSRSQPDRAARANPTAAPRTAGNAAPSHQ